MNIFLLSEDPSEAAKAMTSKHVVKMVVESAQLLSTAHRILDGEQYIKLSKNNRRLKKWSHPEYDDILYKSTHRNHPSSIWVRESAANYSWLYEHFLALCKEYTARYEKTHLTEMKLAKILKEKPKNIKDINFTAPALAMDESYHVKNDFVKSYRNYYEAEKLKTKSDIDRYKNILKLKT